MGNFRSDLGEQIMDLVDNALNSENYDKLSETIGRQMNKLLGSTGPKTPGSGPYGQNGYYGQGRPGNGYQMPGGNRPGSGYAGPGNSGPYQQGGYRNGQNAYRQGQAPNAQGSYYQNRQNSAYSASGAGREAYEARRRNMMAGQPHAVYGQQGGAAGIRRNVQNRAAQPVLFGKPQDGTAGTLLMIFGGVFAVNNALSLIKAVGALFAGGGVAAVATAGLAFAVCTGAFLWGLGLNNRTSRFKKYVKMLSEKKYASIKDLSAEVGKSEDFVRKDLRGMIGRKWFRQGHLDDKETTMIATDALYEQYRRTQAQADALRKEQEEIEKQYGALSKDVREVLEKGKEYTEKIREVNEALPEIEITEKLTRLENIISKIFARVKEEPGEAKNLSQFMDYYLPTTWKLVSAYREMAEQPVQGENIQTAKKEIKDSLDTINDAFETLLDSMFERQAWDVSTDISVMKSMMKQDGLTGSDFHKKPGVGGQTAAQGNVAVMEEK